MSVKALDPHSRSPDAAVGLDEIGSHRRRRTTTGVFVVCALEVRRLDELFEAMNAAFALEATDGIVQFGVNEPKKCGHRCSVAQVWFVLDDDGTTVFGTNDDGETTP